MADADDAGATEEQQEEVPSEPPEDPSQEPPEDPSQEPPEDPSQEPPEEPSVQETQEESPQDPENEIEPQEGIQDSQVGAKECRASCNSQEGRALQEAQGGKKKNTIAKIQVKPGKSLENEKGMECHYSTRLPAVSYRPAPYSPISYTFRVPTASSPVKINNLLARSPPFYVLLDHTISVIWTIFGSEEYDCPLGIVQLQWALAFLRTIRTRTWTHPPDVELCIEAIEEMLMNRYAELNEDIGDVQRMDGSVRYADGAFGCPKLVTQTVPISLNYADMEEKVERRETIGAQSMTSTDAEEELDKLKKVAGVASIENLDGDKKDKAINILKMWKTDQIEKVKDGLKRLREIEDKMKDIDEHFDGYIEDDMEKLLD